MKQMLDLRSDPNLRSQCDAGNPGPLVLYLVDGLTALPRTRLVILNGAALACGMHGMFNQWWSLCLWEDSVESGLHGRGDE